MKIIKNIIKEAKGIADAVYEKTQEIKTLINLDVRDVQKKQKKGYSIISNIIPNVDIFGKPYQIEYVIKILDPRTNPQKFNYGAHITSRSNSNILHIEVLKIGGEIDPLTLDDSLQHEIEHLYQQSQKGDEKSILGANKFQKRYNLIRQKLNSANDYEQFVARVLYLYYKCEEDAFVNGLYAYMKQSLKDGIDYDVALSRSEVIRYLRLFTINQRQLAKATPQDEDLSNALLSFNITLKGFKTILNKTVKRLKRKINMVLAKLLNEDTEYCWNRLIAEMRRIDKYIPPNY